MIGESDAEIAYARRQDKALEMRRRWAFAECPVCAYCGYVIATLLECRMVVNWAGAVGETKLFHEKPCMATAVELMAIRACRPKRPERPTKEEVLRLMGSWSVSSALRIRNITENPAA